MNLNCVSAHKKENHIVVVVNSSDKKKKKKIITDIKKMIRKENHLLDGGMSFEIYSNPILRKSPSNNELI